MSDFLCIGGRCRSPIACGGFGYCRERNNDGRPMLADIPSPISMSREDDEWEWLLWIVVSLCGLGLSYCVIKIIEVLK